MIPYCPIPKRAEYIVHPCGDKQHWWTFMRRHGPQQKCLDLRPTSTFLSNVFLFPSIKCSASHYLKLFLYSYNFMQDLVGHFFPVFFFARIFSKQYFCTIRNKLPFSIKLIIHRFSTRSKCPLIFRNDKFQSQEIQEPIFYKIYLHFINLSS